MASVLLDDAAKEVRDLPLAPTKENIHHIADALASVFDVLRAIYAVRPDLTPAFLNDVSAMSEANKRLTRALGEAIRFADAGQMPKAIELLSTFAAAEVSPLHKRIAEHELERLKD